MITRQQFDRVRQKAKGLRAMVIGDAMLDKYIYGVVERISPEAPVPVLSHHRTEMRAGGAANVALNLAAWGCDTILIGLTGADTQAEVLTGLLSSQSIRYQMIRDEGRPTTVKTRVVASSHHLLRIDEESVEPLSGDREADAESQIIAAMEAFGPELIILQDYNKGFLTEKIISAVISRGKERGAFLAVDPKERHFFAYRGVDLFKPNLREAIQASGRHLEVQDLGSLCAEWREKMDLGAIAVTLGGQGVFLQRDQEEFHAVPEKAIDVLDVCGAGDAVICTLALSLMAQSGLELSGILANYTGAYVCMHSGVVTVDIQVVSGWL